MTRSSAVDGRRAGRATPPPARVAGRRTGRSETDAPRPARAGRRAAAGSVEPRRSSPASSPRSSASPPTASLFPAQAGDHAARRRPSRSPAPSPRRRPAPPRSELVYDTIQPSLVLIETDRADADGAEPRASGLGSGVVVNDRAASPHRAPRRRRTRPRSRSRSPTARRRPASIVEPATPRTTSPCSSRTSRRRALVPATLGNPGAMRIGSEAYIVGNPFGLYGSLSTGVVSGLDRSFRAARHRPLITRPHPGRRGRQPGQLRRAARSTATGASSGS